MVIEDEHPARMTRASLPGKVLERKRRLRSSRQWRLGSLCRDGEKPDQQSEQNQSTNNREEGVQRMKLKERIALKSMPCRQHETSFEQRVAMATDSLLATIFPRSSAAFQFFITLLF
jgi:hypothetical protein